MNLKLVKIASVREHLDAHYRGEITYSKAVDLINEDANKQLRLYGVVKSLPQDNFCKVCNLPTDGKKCYSKRCPV